jgi:hypothetical protein
MVNINGVSVRKGIKLKDLPLWKPLIIKDKGAGDEEGDMIEVTLDINGVRAKKKIKIDDIGKWEKCIVGDTEPGGDEYTTVLLNFGGQPIERKIKTSMLHLYAPYIVKPGDRERGQSSAEIEELRKQVAQMADMLAQERNEKAREREAEKYERQFEALRQEISQLRSKPQTYDDPVQKRIDEMEKQFQAQKDEVYMQQMTNLQQTLDSYRQEMQRLRDQLSNMSNFDYAIEQQQRFAQLARKQGYVDAREARRLSEEDIEMEDRLNMVKRKDEAQARVLNIAANKLEKTGDLKNAFINNGGADLLIDMLKKITTPKEEQEAAMYRPTVEDLRRKAEQLVRAEAEQYPPQPEQPVEQPAPSGSTEEGKRKEKPTVSIIVEEAPRVLSAEKIEQGGNIYSTIAREGRKFKIGLVAITQLTSVIPRMVLTNMNTKIILGNEMATERRAIVDSAAQDLSEEDRTIASLDKGEAIVSSIFTKFAVPIYTPLFEDIVGKKDEFDFKGENLVLR